MRHGHGRGQRQLLGLLVAALALGLWWWAGAGGSTDSTDQGRRGDSVSERRTPSEGAGTDPASGLAWVSEADLPPEAAETLDLIDAGGPFPEDEDGDVFGNRERILPIRERGYYHEYTVPTPGEDDRGARRVVTGAAGEYYWTGDHYQSFERILR